MNLRSRAAVLAVVLAVGSPGVADAQSFSGSGWDAIGGLAVAGAVVGGAAYLTLETTLIALSVDRGMHGHGFETGWAGVEFAWGIVSLAGGITGLATSVYRGIHYPTASMGDIRIGRANATFVDGGRLGAGIPLTLIGVYHIAHAIYSLAEGGPPSRFEASSSASFDLQGVRGGALLLITGTTG